MFSFTLQMLDARKLPLMQHVVCLSITEAIKELCRAKVRLYFSVVMFSAY
jgi:biotin--protein ligase